MGWNSWDSYGLTITEDQFRANVKVLRNELEPPAITTPSSTRAGSSTILKTARIPDKLVYAIDANGRYVPVPARFPSAGKADAAADAGRARPLAGRHTSC